VGLYHRKIKPQPEISALSRQRNLSNASSAWKLSNNQNWTQRILSETVGRRNCGVSERREEALFGNETSGVIPLPAAA
jgi:hypothetical protein